MLELLAAAVALVGTPERVIDVDTLELAGTRVRLWGVQAPERRNYCQRIGQAAFRCDCLARDFVIQLSAKRLIPRRGHT